MFLKSATFLACAYKLTEPINTIGLKWSQCSPKDKRKFVLQKWAFVVWDSLERDNEFDPFWRRRPFSS